MTNEIEQRLAEIEARHGEAMVRKYEACDWIEDYRASVADIPALVKALRRALNDKWPLTYNNYVHQRSDIAAILAGKKK